MNNKQKKDYQYKTLHNHEPHTAHDTHAIRCGTMYVGVGDGLLGDTEDLLQRGEGPLDDFDLSQRLLAVVWYAGVSAPDNKQLSRAWAH